MKKIICIIGILILMAALAYAVDVKISDMKEERYPDGGDLVPIVDISGATNRRTTIAHMIRSGVTQISGTTIEWTSGVTLPRLAGVTDYVQVQLNYISGTSFSYTTGVTGPYLYGAPNFQSGESSYVLTSIGVGGIPIWTNAPAGTGSSSNVFTSGLSTAGVSIFHTPAFDKTPLYITTDQDGISGITVNATPHNAKIGIAIVNDGATWRIVNDGADGAALKFYRGSDLALEIDSTTLSAIGAMTAGGNISGASIYSYATDSIGGLYLYTKSIAGKYVLIKVKGDLANDYILTLPSDDGNASEYLQTDGSGNLSWSAAGAGDVTKAMLDDHTDLGAFSGVTWFMTHAEVAANTVNVSGASGALTKTYLDSHTDDGAFSGTSNFALKAALTASTLTLSGVSGEATNASLASHTGAAAFAGSTSGVSDFAVKVATSTALNAASFSGTTGFALHTSLAANTLALSGVSGEATKASLASHTDAAAFANSTSGVSDFAPKAALTAAVASAAFSGTTWFVPQNTLAAALQSGATLQQVANGTVVGKMYYDLPHQQIFAYGATSSGNSEFVVSGITESFAFIISGVTHGRDNATPWGTKNTGQDDIILWQPPYKIIVKEVYGICDAGTSSGSGATVVWNLQNCNSGGASCVDMLSTNLGSGTTGISYGTIGHSDVSPFETLRLNVIWSGVSSSGVTQNFTGTINYWRARP